MKKIYFHMNDDFFYITSFIVLLLIKIAVLVKLSGLRLLTMFDSVIKVLILFNGGIMVG